MRLATQLQADVPGLAYLAPALERYCSAGPEQMLRLVQEASRAELDRLQQVAERLLQNQGSDYFVLLRYIETLRTSDPAAAATLEGFVRRIMPVPG